jgi:hypothetical protein
VLQYYSRVDYFLYNALAYYVAFLYKKKYFTHQCSEIMSEFFFVFSLSIIGFVLTLIMFIQLYSFYSYYVTLVVFTVFCHIYVESSSDFWLSIILPNLRFHCTPLKMFFIFIKVFFSNYFLFPVHFFCIFGWIYWVFSILTPCYM